MIVAAGSATALVPPWLAFPVAAFLVVAIAIHLQSLKVAEIPESRRRIRTANGWVMLIATPVTAYAFGAVTTQNPRVYVLAWLAVAGLLAMVVILALLDVVNNRRIHREEARELGRDFAIMQGRRVVGTGGGNEGAMRGYEPNSGGRDGG